jgi:hypothetical protein
MTKLHELLAVEKTRTNAAQKLMQDTMQKFSKSEMFSGGVKTLKMIEDSPQNKAIEAAAQEQRELPTTVAETLEYAMNVWAQAEDVLMQKNCTNTIAVADIEYQGSVIASAVPVDELLGLESRLESLRKIMEGMPTLSAAVAWEPDTNSGRKGAWQARDVDTTTKTEKTMVPVVLYEATDKHPAQVKEVSQDKTVGTFKLVKFCGGATSAQKAETLAAIDELIGAVKQARMRANSVEAVNRKIGQDIVAIVMKAFK